MPEQPYDLLIRGGTVIDGTGAPGARADVAVRGDRIDAVGEIEGSADRVIDAAGLVVAPGFIDVHAHDDAAALTSPMDFKLLQGVTTDVVGNCGAGVAPFDPERPPMPGMDIILGGSPEVSWRTFGEYMRAVEAARPGINVACLVPHGAVRNAVLGLNNRAPDGGELRRMREYVAEGVAEGAVGFSTGLIYPPGSFAQTDEIIECAEAAAEGGAIYVSHIRNEAEHLMEAVEEATTIGREAGLPVQISHFKAAGRPNWGKTTESVRYVDEQRAAGLDVTFDVYPYTAASTVLSAMVRVREDTEAEEVMLASVNGHPEWEGRMLTDVAEELDLPPDEAASRIIREDPACTAIFFVMDEADVQRVLGHPQCMIGSDGLPSPGKPHPRLFGTFPRVLGRYVREERLLSLEEAVRKMTSLPARRFQLAERGELREGWAADIVVFDPERVTDTATYEDPRRHPAGIEWVIVNGEVAAEGGRQVATHAGRLLRRGRA